MDPEHRDKQSKYDDFVNHPNKAAHEIGERPPYHLSYAKKIKKMQQKRNGGQYE